jgi:hypothetical protein
MVECVWGMTIATQKVQFLKKKSLSNTTLSTTMHAWAGPGLNPILCDGMSAIYSLSYGMAPTV